VDDAIAPRDLRNHYGDVLRRVREGGQVDIVKDGVVVASVVPPRRPEPTTSRRLREVFAGAEPIDRAAFFADLDRAVDAEAGDPWERG
jgi:prevent-host-death family protein